MDNLFGKETDLRRMEMLRAALPYIPLSMQKFLNIYIGFEELIQAVQTIRQAAASSNFYNQDTPLKSEELMKVLRGFCTPKENETIDMMMNMVKTMSMYDEYKDMFSMFSQSFSAENEDSSKNNPIHHPSEKPDSEKASYESPSSSPAQSSPLELLQSLKNYKNNSEIDDIFKDYSE